MLFDLVINDKKWAPAEHHRQPDIRGYDQQGDIAEKEADDIVKEAENRILSMIDEHEITKKAYEKKAEIIETANEMSREISKGTKDYADNVLNGIEVALQEALRIIQNNRNELK